MRVKLVTGTKGYQEEKLENDHRVYMVLAVIPRHGLAVFSIVVDMWDVWLSFGIGAGGVSDGCWFDVWSIILAD